MSDLETLTRCVKGIVLIVLAITASSLVACGIGLCCKLLGKREKRGLQSHVEIIRCPDCGICQKAIVEHTFPWWDRTHCCIECGFWIMESEWERIEPVTSKRQVKRGVL